MDREKMIEEMAAEISTWDRRFDSALTIAECVLDRLDQLGLCVVPKESSEAMIDVGAEPLISLDGNGHATLSNRLDARACYRAMIAAAKGPTSSG